MSVDIRTPKSAKELNDSMNSPIKTHNGYYQIRDVLSKNPKRVQNVVEAYWLDNPHNEERERKAKEFWDSGKYDVVKENGHWLDGHGKYIPGDIGEKVKEIINREVR
jgi:hypothetical protein